MKDETIVVFRVWKCSDRWEMGCSAIALFPEIPADLTGNLCQSYGRVGQHGGADYLGCIGQTRPASKEERRSLVLELEKIGYRLRIAKRATQAMHEARRREAKRMR